MQQAHELRLAVANAETQDDAMTAFKQYIPMIKAREAIDHYRIIMMEDRSILMVDADQDLAQSFDAESEEAIEIVSIVLQKLTMELAKEQ
jgi:hypothetical protein